MDARWAVVVPWARAEQRDLFLRAWGAHLDDDHLFMQQDVDREGCGVTKCRGIDRAVAAGAEFVVVLDDDCFPEVTTQYGLQPRTLSGLAEVHHNAMRPQQVKRFRQVTRPASRGTPYKDVTMAMPVAASMGFWTEVGDYCAVRQLAFGATFPMIYERETIYNDYFPLCGMNLAFFPGMWDPWWRFIDVPRYDDIWMGWLWQREAYRRGYCFNLGGPMVRHSRQSNVWQNLKDEAKYAEANESLWREIAAAPYSTYDELRKLLPV